MNTKNEYDNIDITCGFTGHRPNKLGGYSYHTPLNLEIMEKTKFKILKNLIIKKNCKRFIVGGALGFDQMVFDVLVELRDLYDIKIIVAIPFEEQDNNWPESSKIYYRNQLKKADELVYVDKLPEYKIKNLPENVYHAAKMQKRNEYMVDQSKYYIACFDGTNGGTKNCVDYFLKTKNKADLFVINPKDLSKKSQPSKISKSELNVSPQNYKTIPLKLISRNYDGYKAKRYIINETNQNVWIPNIYLEEDGTIKKNVNLDFIFFKKDNINKLELANLTDVFWINLIKFDKSYKKYLPDEFKNDEGFMEFLED